MAPVHCSNGGIPDTLRQYIVLLGSPNESAAITRFDEVSLKCCEMSVTNRTGSANAKYNGFVIIGKKLRVGQVIFLQARCERSSSRRHQARPRCCGVNGLQAKCLELKIQPREGI